MTKSEIEKMEGDMYNFFFTVGVQLETKVDAIKFAHGLANSLAFKPPEPMTGVEVSLGNEKLYRVHKGGDVVFISIDKHSE